MDCRDITAADYPWATLLDVSCSVLDTKPRMDAAEYGSSVSARIECLLPPRGHARVVGTISVEKVFVSDARKHKFSLRNIFLDKGLDQYFDFLFTAQEVIRPELRIKRDWIDFQVVTNMTLRPRCRTKSVITRSLETIIDFLGPRDLIVVSAWNGPPAFTEGLVELGFKQVPGKNWAIRAPSLVDAAKRNRSRRGTRVVAKPHQRTKV